MKNEENKQLRNSLSNHMLQNFFSKYKKFIENATKKNNILIQIYSLYSELYSIALSFVKKIKEQTDIIIPKENQNKNDYFYTSIKLINNTLEKIMNEGTNLLKDLLPNLNSLLDKTKIENKNVKIELELGLKKIEEEKTKLETDKNAFQTSSKKIESEVLNKLVEANKRDKPFDEVLKSNDLFKDLKINYMNYNSGLEKVNKQIVVCNNIHNSILNMYEDYDSNYLEFTNNILNLFYVNQATIISLISKNKTDIKDMIILNNNNVLDSQKRKKVREGGHKNLLDLIKFENFESKINFLNILSNDEFNRCIYTIELFRKNLDDNIYPDISIEKEKERNKEREKIINLINGTKNISGEDKIELFTLLKKDEYYQKLFLSILNKVRISGKFMKDKELITLIGDVFKIIIDTSETKKDYEAVKHCIILSQTFYYEDDKKKKIYIVDLIKKSKWLHNTEFWRNYVDLLIVKEFIKYQNIHKEKDLNIFMKNNISEKAGDKIGELLFSQLMPSVNNMVELGVEKNIIARVCEEFINKYNYLNQANIDILYSFISQDNVEINKLREEAKKEISLKFANMNDKDNKNKGEKEKEIKENKNEEKEENKNETIEEKNKIKENKNEIIEEKNEIKENKNEINENKNINNESKDEIVEEKNKIKDKEDK